MNVSDVNCNSEIGEQNGTERRTVCYLDTVLNALW